MSKAFPKLRPTDKHTIKPGPAVEATASISFILTPLSSIAFLTIKSIFSYVILLQFRHYLKFFMNINLLDTTLDKTIGTHVDFQLK